MSNGGVHTPVTHFSVFGLTHLLGFRFAPRLSAVSIIINSITLWNTMYLPKAVEKLKEKKKLTNHSKGL